MGLSELGSGLLPCPDSHGERWGMWFVRLLFCYQCPLYMKGQSVRPVSQLHYYVASLVRPFPVQTVFVFPLRGRALLTPLHMMLAWPSRVP